MPLAGMRCRFTDMLIADWVPNRMARPAAAKREKRILVAHGAHQSADDDEGEQRDERQAERDAEFLRRHREHEIRVAFGQQALDGALARPAPNQPPRMKLSVAMSMLKVSPDAGLRNFWMRLATCGTV